jgi:ATP synthase I chain
VTRRSASLQAKHLLLLALAIGGAIPYGCHAVWSLALAGGIQVVNVAVTTRSVRLVVAQPVSASGAHLVFLLRLFAVLAAIFLALRVLGAAPLPFAIGLLVIVPAAVWHGLSQAREA